MIARIRGTVLTRSATTVVVDLHGLGILVTGTPRALIGAHVGAEVDLATSLVVREDQWQLYGFADERERETFTLLQSVSGIGPRIALAALSTLDPDRLAAAIGSGDIAALTKVPGIGRKGAERLCVELRDRLPALAMAGGGWRAAVHEALVGLGWSAVQADGAITRIAEQEAEPDVPTALRAALQLLGRA